MRTQIPGISSRKKILRIKNLNLPKEGKPELTTLEHPETGQLTPTAKSNVRVTFSDKIPIEEELVTKGNKNASGNRYLMTKQSSEDILEIVEKIL